MCSWLSYPKANPSLPLRDNIGEVDDVRLTVFAGAVTVPSTGTSPGLRRQPRKQIQLVPDRKRIWIQRKM